MHEGYLALFVVVLGINLLLAFGPPTWSIIALYGVTTDLPIAGLVAVGALAAALGRRLLALATRALGGFLPAKLKASAEAARALVSRRRSSSVAALGLFALSPLPSGQLFVAAGLARAPLPAFTAAFFAGRVVSYTVYFATAQLARASAQAWRIRFSWGCRSSALLSCWCCCRWIGRLWPGKEPAIRRERRGQ